MMPFFNTVHEGQPSLKASSKFKKSYKLHSNLQEVEYFKDSTMQNIILSLPPRHVIEYHGISSKIMSWKIMS